MSGCWFLNFHLYVCCLIIDDEGSFYLYIAGEAGTGKSYLVSLMIEIIKHIKLKSGDDLQKPPAIVMAPTANAAFLIGGKTIDSALGFFPMENNRYSQAQPGKMSMMKCMSYFVMRSAW